MLIAILIPLTYLAGYIFGRLVRLPGDQRIKPMPEREIIAFETLRARRAERETSK